MDPEPDRFEETRPGFSGPADGLPDTAMGSGSDDGEAGERRPEPLSAADRRVLEALSRHAPAVVEAVEETDRAARTVDDDAPLPDLRDGRPGGDDPLTPVFREPR